MASTADYECSVCACDQAGPARHFIDGDALCPACIETSIIPSFADALKHEHLYPVKGGSTTVEAEQFQDLLPSGFMKEWAMKKAERATPAAHRIYCPNPLETDPKYQFGFEKRLKKHRLLALTKEQIEHLGVAKTNECGAFIGRKAISSSQRAILSCPLCHGSICSLGCGEIDPGGTHVCVRPEPSSLIPEGMVVGKDVQICPDPDCGTLVQVAEACNHVLCPRDHANVIFNRGFCFICGKSVAHGDKLHFTVGCPRWNQPGASNAMYDRVRTVRVEPEALDDEDEAVFRRDHGGDLLVLTNFLSAEELAQRNQEVQQALIDVRRMIFWAARKVEEDAELANEIGPLASNLYKGISEATYAGAINVGSAEDELDRVLGRHEWIQEAILELDEQTFRMLPRLVPVVDQYNDTFQPYFNRLEDLAEEEEELGLVGFVELFT